jgi:hypothetical protein
VNHNFGLLIETLVAILLVITIGYCVLLNKRLRRLRSDEMSLKATISELITATEIAERAVGGLKVVVRECDQDLGERLRAAEAFSADIARQLAAGEEILSRLTRIATATRPARELREAEAPDARATLAAAQAFAERARARVSSVAA